MRLALKVVMLNDGDFVDVIVLYQDKQIVETRSKQQRILLRSKTDYSPLERRRNMRTVSILWGP